MLQVIYGHGFKFREVNPFQKPIENVALNSEQPHRFGLVSGLYWSNPKVRSEAALGFGANLVGC
jgi:hypothetical protein